MGNIPGPQSDYHIPLPEPIHHPQELTCYLALAGGAGALDVLDLLQHIVPRSMWWVGINKNTGSHS